MNSFIITAITFYYTCVIDGETEVRSSEVTYPRATVCMRPVLRQVLRAGPGRGEGLSGSGSGRVTGRDAPGLVPCVAPAVLCAAHAQPALSGP